jgi:hypothetical protein
MRIRLKRESWGYSYTSKNGDVWSVTQKGGPGYRGWWNVTINDAPCDSVYGLDAVRTWIDSEERCPY